MCTPKPRSQNGQGDCGIESKKEYEHVTTNPGGKGGHYVLLPITAKIDEGTMVSSPKRMRDTQKVTREAREGTTYSYASWMRWTWRLQSPDPGGTHNNQPGGGKVTYFNDASRNGIVLRRTEYIEDENAQDMDDQDTYGQI